MTVGWSDPSKESRFPFAVAVVPATEDASSAEIDGACACAPVVKDIGADHASPAELVALIRNT